jgi:hypothetical protein
MSDSDLNAQIRERAYHIWENEGRPAGRQLSHWLQAEAELQTAAPAPQQKAKPAKKASSARAANAARLDTAAKRPRVSH